MNRMMSFLRNTSGQVSVLFAIAVVPLLISAGAAIDYVGAYRANTQLQSAIDAAAMAVATAHNKTNVERKEIGMQFLSENLHGVDLANVDASIVIEDGVVTISAKYPYPTSFMALAGIDEMPVNRQAQVAGGRDMSAEVVMVLDYSKSMEDSNKYVRMRNAASDLVDQLVAAKGDGSLKFGIVPFSSMVRTSMPREFVTQASQSSTWTGCTQDRKYPYNTGISTPTGANDTKWGYIENSPQNTGASNNCTAYANKKIKILPLTEDANTVKDQLADMRPIGYTNIPLGVEFGWNLLDPSEPFTEGASLDDRSTRKFIIILTDGVQTTPGWGPNNSRTLKRAQENLVKLCQGMRVAGVTIFTIAYDVTDTDVTTLLKSCAGQNYFQSESGAAAISSVFNDISIRIRKSALRLSR